MHRYVIENGQVYNRNAAGVLHNVPTHSLSGLIPENPEQKMAWAACMSLDYMAVGLHGVVGTGKTMIGVLAGLALVAKNEFQEFIYTRPPVEKQYKLGFLPGDEDMKLAPWMGALWDQVELVHDPKIKRLLEEGTKIKTISIEKLKGRTFRNAYVLIDEAQDTREDTMEMMIGRCGAHSKLVGAGDINQVDAPGVSLERNGLVHLRTIDDQEDVANIELITPLRGRGAELSLLMSQRRRERDAALAPKPRPAINIPLVEA